MRTWPISRKLLAITAFLLVVLSATVGTVSILALQRNLVDRIDEQVNAGISIRVMNPSTSTTGQTTTPTKPSNVEELPRGKRIGMLTATVRSNTIESVEYFAENGYNAEIGEDTKAILLAIPVDAKIRTIDLGQLGEFRMAARDDTDDGTVLISGISLVAAEATVANLTYVFVLVTLFAILLLLTIGSAIIRTSLRPLTSIAETAVRISRQPLAEGDIEGLARVPQPHEETEVGQVAQAINGMLGHIETALTKRQASEDKLRQFIADASHELRTPLASVRGYSELSLRHADDLPPQHRLAIERINSESIRMSDLVQDLLLLARLDAGQEIKHELVDISGLLANAVQDAAVSGLDHTWSFDQIGQPSLVFGDPSALHQVLGNLLTNARIHTPPGTTVRAEIRGTATTVVIEICDNGPGIDPEILPHLFERFVRGDDSRSRQAGSSGLGLAIVRAIIEAHRGTIEVLPQQPGACFRITLPAAGNDGTHHQPISDS